MIRILPFALWGIATLLAVFARPVTPIDETRYLAVAWEMFRTGEYWLLTLNGELYAHKPPLLFWLISLGWTLTGVNDIWPRLLTATFGLGVLVLTRQCALNVFGKRRELAELATLILASGAVWLLFTGAVMFDVPLTFFTLMAIHIVLGMTGRGRVIEWLLVGLALGFGFLMKGPVALLHVVPFVLLAPLWQPQISGGGEKFDSRWYVGIALALLVTVLLATSWLEPALARGGPSLYDEFLWRQTIDRMATTTHHLRPWWFYLAILPALLLPWLLLPAVWRGIRRLAVSRDSGRDLEVIRIVAAWVLPVLLALSCFRGKQLHYLFPLLPAFSILMAHAIGRATPKSERMLIAAPLFSVGVLIALYAVINLRFSAAYDTGSMAMRISALQDRGWTIANIGRYHGQYHFAGRLKRPIVVIEDDEDWQRFRLSRSDGFVVTYSRAPRVNSFALLSVPFRSRYATLWRLRDIRDRPFSEIEDQ